MDSEIIRKLRAKAERCRQLAAKASDGEAADSLLQLAAEIEAALPILEGNKNLVDSAQMGGHAYSSVPEFMKN